MAVEVDALSEIGIMVRMLSDYAVLGIRHGHAGKDGPVKCCTASASRLDRKVLPGPFRCLAFSKGQSNSQGI